MKKSLSLKETIFVASMLFGMFFGAGNLIFPVSMPTSQEMPFTRVPEKKIGVEDVQRFLTSHYNGTPYDPMDTSSTPIFFSGTRVNGIS